MILEIRMKVNLVDVPEPYAKVDDLVHYIQGEFDNIEELFPSLAREAKEPMCPLILIEGKRVQLRGHGRACQECLRPMGFVEIGPDAWQCVCGKREGRRSSA